MILEIICIALLAGLLFVVAYIVLGKIYKNTRKNVKKGIRFSYRLIPRKLDMPDYIQSPYFNRYPMKNERWTEDYWRFCATVHDPFMKAIASQILEKTKGKSDRYRAGYILKVAQCIYTYESDKDIYGQTDRWQFPICTAYIRTGDCEDGSFIGAGLSYLCGLDTVVIYRTGHALYGVNVKGFGMRIEHNGKRYLQCETTAILPLGITLSSGAFKKAYDIQIPPEDFISNYTFIDQFDKYKH